MIVDPFILLFTINLSTSPTFPYGQRPTINGHLHSSLHRMQGYPVAFGIFDERTVTQVRTYFGFHFYNGPACLFHFIQKGLQVRFAVQVDERSLFGRLEKFWIVHDGTTTPFIFEIVQEKTHACRPHMVLGHLVTEDVFIKFFGTIEIRNGYLEPVECMFLYHHFFYQFTEILKRQTFLFCLPCSMRFRTIVFFLLLCFTAAAQQQPFRFAFLSDTHIGSPNGAAEEDLRLSVADINSMEGIAFVVLTGDITELGTNRELAVAKRLLDSLDIPYYIIPGNHDTGWSESGGLGFTKIFGSDKFYFTHNGFHFIGCASGPYVRMSDGHVPRDAMIWLGSILQQIGPDEPVVFLNHYPLDAGLDNWYEVIGLLKKKNTVLALCGHGHNNREVKAEDIPAVMGRSNLRARQAAGGYNLVDVTIDSFLFTERNPVDKTEKHWKSVALKRQQYDTAKKFPRPDFSINQKYRKQVSAAWTFQSPANVISTPAVSGNHVVFGNQAGTVQAVTISNGKKAWAFQTGGPIFSSPAVSRNRIVVGSADGNVYCLNGKGELQWKVTTGAPVLGSPAVENGIVYIGGSDSSFRALQLASGQEVWRFAGLEGAVTSQPVVNGNKVLFGAWDRMLYALDKSVGKLLWKWSNGSPLINYAPAACIPVVKDEVVYVVAPDRFLSAIDLSTGKTLYRTNEATVRESIGMSTDGRFIYAKTMNDTVVAFHTNREKPELAWKMPAGYGYDHVPSMLIQKGRDVYFGTRSGVVYALNPRDRKISWAYKIDNSMVNTVNVISPNRLIAATMDGKVSLLRF